MVLIKKRVYNEPQISETKRRKLKEKATKPSELRGKLRKHSSSVQLSFRKI